MPDILIDVGPMGFSKDTNKVAVKYTTWSQQVMQDALKAAVTQTPGFTLDKTVVPKGYTVNLTLAEVSFITLQGMPGVKALLDGAVASYPAKLLVSSSLFGSAKIGGDTSDGAVKDAVKEAVKVTMRDSIFPTIKRL
jgi:hypothetical protein